MSLTYDYYSAVLYAINLLGQGHTLTQACDRSNIGVPTFKKYIASSEELQDMFTDAEQRGRDAMAEALINIDNHDVHGQSDPKMAKVISDNIKWFLAKKDPKNYGERVTVEQSFTVDIAITTALDAARRRSAQIEHHDVRRLENVEDAEVLPVETEDERIMREILS